MQVVDFGKLSFKEQIRTVYDAAVLAGISGSDLINAIFLPSRGVLVEIDPANRGAQVCNPALLHSPLIYLCLHCVRDSGVELLTSLLCTCGGWACACAVYAAC